MFVCLGGCFFSTQLKLALHSIKLEVGQTCPATCQNTNEFDKTCFPNSTSAQRDCKTFKRKTIYPVYMAIPPEPLQFKRNGPNKIHDKSRHKLRRHVNKSFFCSGTRTPIQNASPPKKNVKNAHTLAQGETIIDNCLPLGHMLCKLTIASCFPCILASPLSRETGEGRKSATITHHKPIRPLNKIGNM